MIEDPKDDSVLIARILNGEVQLFGILVTRYERLIYSFLLPQAKSFQEVQDISQEAFLKAYRHLGSFDSKRRFSAWILKTARNVLIDRYRKNSESLSVVGASVQEIIEQKPSNPENDPSHRAEAREEFKRTFIHILQLSEELKAPLLLRVLHELSYEEIAEVLEIPVQTVRNRIFQARKALRERRDAENAM